MSRHWPPIAGLTAVTLMVVLGALVVARPDGSPLPIDTAWLAMLNQNRTPLWDSAAQVLDVLGGGGAASFVIPGLLIVALLLAYRRWGAGYAAIVLVLTGASVQILKHYFARERPANELIKLDFGSFPSGHVANAAVLATVLALLVPRVWVWVAGLGYTILMMLGRTYLAAHWLSDTVGAVLLAVGIGVLVWAPFAAKIEGERVLTAGRSTVWRRLWNRFGPLVSERRDLSLDDRRWLVRTALVTIALAIVGGAALLVSVLRRSGLTVLDEPVQSLMLDWRSPTLTVVMIFFAILFGPIALPIIVLIVSVGWGAMGRHAWRPLLLAVAMVVGVGLGQIIGRVVDRQRPSVELMLFGPDASFSFPSGHVLGAADFVLIMAYLVISRRYSRRGVVIAAACVTVCIVLAGVSRIYLGYHWVTDAVASVTVSFIVLGCVVLVDVWWSSRLQSGTPRSGEAVPSVADQSDADRAENHGAVGERDESLERAVEAGRLARVEGDRGDDDEHSDHAERHALSDVPDNTEDHDRPAGSTTWN